MTESAKQTRAQHDMSVNGMRVLVVGLARTGIAAARFLSNRGARVIGVDIRNRSDLETEFPEVSELSIDLQVGGHHEEHFLHTDLIVVSPGVSPFIDPLVKARALKIPIVSEIELASWFISTPIVGVTGTNGKTTTALLIGEMLREAGTRVFVGGNIGNPLINLVASDEKTDVAVIELSSFQLEGIQRFRPTIAVLLNISEDHLDRYASFDAYVASKSRLFMNQTASDFAVVNASDPIARRVASSSRARRVDFNVTENQRTGTLYDGRRIILRERDREEIYDPGKSRLIGIHNIENMMAAIVTARLRGCPREVVQQTLETFHGLTHRLEFVREVKGVSYFNDSKGTNVGAVVKSLQTFPGRIILIAGGRDKGGDYSPLKEPIRERVKHLIFIGEARERMAHQLKDTAPFDLADSLQEAVDKAHCLAVPGDTVLLSPACSSYDMFRDYVERGDTFKARVERLVHSGEA